MGIDKTFGLIGGSSSSNDKSKSEVEMLTGIEGLEGVVGFRKINTDTNCNCGGKCRSEDDIYKRAIEAWGEEKQINMVVEECGELLSAINKFRRGRITKEAMFEEAADVSIMIKQFREFDKELFDSLEKMKIERIRNRLDNLSK